MVPSFNFSIKTNFLMKFFQENRSEHKISQYSILLSKSRTLQQSFKFPFIGFWSRAVRTTFRFASALLRAREHLIFQCKSSRQLRLASRGLRLIFAHANSPRSFRFSSSKPRACEYSFRARESTRRFLAFYSSREKIYNWIYIISRDSF
jgi:hypothetical protein